MPSCPGVGTIAYPAASFLALVPLLPPWCWYRCLMFRGCHYLLPSFVAIVHLGVGSTTIGYFVVFVVLFTSWRWSYCRLIFSFLQLHFYSSSYLSIALLCLFFIFLFYILVNFWCYVFISIFVSIIVASSSYSSSQYLLIFYPLSF